MPDKASPFAGLDKALLRGSKGAPAAPAEPVAEPEAAPVTAPPVATATPRHRGTTAPAVTNEAIARVRKAVRQPGKEAGTLRLSDEEKRQLRDIEYTYGRQNRRTSQTQLIRIAVNLLLDDYERNGELSVLERVMQALES